MPFTDRSSGVNSVPPDSGAPDALGPPDHVLLGLEALAVPGLDVHVDPARDQVGPAREPGLVVVGRDPDVAVEVVGLLRLDVERAVLEAEQVAWSRLRRRGGRRTPEAELRPAHRDGPEADPGEVADRVDRHLGVLRAGLHADVAARLRRVELVTGEVRQVAQRLGLTVCQAEPVAAVARPGTVPGPKPKVRVRPPGVRPIASPVSSGGTSGAPSVGPTGPAGSPWVIRSAAVVHAFSSDTSCARERVVTSNAAKCSRSWAGVTMPAWCSPRNGYVVGAPAAASPLVGAWSSPYHAPTAKPAATPATPAVPADQAASRDLELGDGCLLRLRAARLPSGGTAAPTAR